MASLRQLEYLVAIVNEGSFTRAAERLHVSQPALSHQIAALERGLGGPLLERLPRAVRLTPMGRAMVPHARAALAEAERARCVARQSGGLEQAELQLATVYSISLGVLPPVLRAWRQSHGGVQIRLFEHRHTNDLRTAMAAGQADLAIGPRSPGWEGPEWSLGDEEFVVVLPEGDPAVPPKGGSLALSALADRSWVHYAPGHGLAEVLDRACAAAGFQPAVAIRTEQTAAASLLALAGLGPALLPANTIPVGFPGRTFRLAPAITRELVAYTRSAPDPLTEAFLAVLRRSARV